MKKILIIVGIAVGVLLIAGGGITYYGLHKASQIKNYAKQARSVIDESMNKWTYEKMDYKKTEKDLEEIKADALVIKTDAENQLNRLGSLKAPKKAASMETKAKEYFTLARDTAEEVINYYDYAKVWWEIGNLFTSFGSFQATTMEEIIAEFENMRNTTGEALNKLRAAAPPDFLQDWHNQVYGATEKFDQTLLKSINLLRDNKLDEFAKTMETEFNAVGQEFNAIEQPDYKTNLSKIATDEIIQKIKNYPQEIRAEADKLLEINFSF